METKKEKKISKRKLKSDVKIIEKAHRFVSEPKANEKNEEEIDEAKKKMKELKREKMRLKRQKKKEEKLKQFKKRETDEFAKSAIAYLHLWNENKAVWTFKKNMQMWLLNNIYDQQKLSNEDFQVLLLYMLDSKGAVRQRTVEQAESIISTWDSREDGVIQLETQIKTVNNITDASYQRARDIVQTLI